MATVMIPVSLPKAAKEAADRGDLLTAINLTRQTMGVALDDAQHAVHAYLSSGKRTGSAFGSLTSDSSSPFPHSAAAPGAPTDGLPPQALTALSRGSLIEAIKHTRNATGLGLKEAKDKVETYIRQNPSAKRQLENALSGSRTNMTPALAVLALVLVAAGAFAAYLFGSKG